MQLETGHPICSLCKRDLTASSLDGSIEGSFDGGPGTKLCQGCRGLIQTALHGPEARVVAASVDAGLSGVATYVQSDASTALRVETDSPGFFDSLSTFADVSEQDQQAAFVERDPGLSEMAFEASAGLDLKTDSLDAPAVESIEHHDEAFVVTAPSNESTRAESGELRLSLSDGDNPNALPSTFNAPELAEPDVRVSGEIGETHDIESMSTASTAAVADPWEEPLPAWDYSRNEWPVLMGPPRKRSFAKFKIPFALLVILAFGAGFYYFIYPQISRNKALPTDSAPLVLAPEPRESAAKPADSTAQSQAPSVPSDAAASEGARPKPAAVRDAAVASEVIDSKGRFTLQAAAFPTQAGADELAQKLKAAGLPSYVVSVDLARRGRWFRVRVGRFNTAEEAQRFAGEAQLRAKAAGMSVQLIASQYEQP
jgi:cell division septation protein DedD